MPSYTHNTAPTQLVEAAGIRFAYRRFGGGRATPLVLLQHFRGDMDNYYPAITDGLARDREIILFDNTGVGATSGRARDNVDYMARDAAKVKYPQLFVRQVRLFLHEQPVL